MRPQHISLAQQLTQCLHEFDRNIHALPGVSSPNHLSCLLAQIIDSIRRIKYVEVIKNRPLSNIYIDSTGQVFDPIKAAAWCIQNYSIEEAFWLVFIATHFGKNRKSGWGLAKAVYAGQGSGGIWTWTRTSNDFSAFRNWLYENMAQLKLTGHFGNHHKYQSLDAYSSTGTGTAIGSYIDWVGTNRGHRVLVQDAIAEVGRESRELFHYLYQSMSTVISFGRTAKFDYLTMIGKLGLAPIVPGSAYIEEASGPKRGAKLLFGGSVTAALSNEQLNALLSSLDQHMGLYFGMQVLEDSLCNWQKNPAAYSYFGG